MNYAIFLAGGTGRRIHTDVPKQFVRAGGRMMVTWSLETLLVSEYIDTIYVVAEQGWRERILADARDAGLDISKIKGFAIPGLNRQDSIRNGIRSIFAGMDSKINKETVRNDDTVLIHDAARPFLRGWLLDACYEALDDHEGVMPVLPMKDTVYLSRDGQRVSKLVDRDTIYAGQAPEVFRFGAYHKANMVLTPETTSRIHGAAEPAVMAGMDIVMIQGDEDNFKVTSDADLKRYQEIMERRQDMK